MSKQEGRVKTEELVRGYFEYVKKLRSGEKGSVEKLLEMWDEDGVFEFVGSPPVTGSFKGKNAIHALYKNRFHSSGMELKLEGTTSASKQRGTQDIELGLVESNVNRIKLMDSGRAVAAWTTIVSTVDKRGFQVSGSHEFTFKDGKISTLKIVVSPRPHEAKGLNLEDLSVQDVGQLSKAAWAVV